MSDVPSYMRGDPRKPSDRLSDAQLAAAAVAEEHTHNVCALREALTEIINRASNFADADAADWMPSIYKIACEATGSDPWPLLIANGYERNDLALKMP